jgi:hypothetical protein
MILEEKIAVWYEMLEKSKTIGTFNPGDEDGTKIEELSEEEAQDKFNLLVELFERPTGVGRI